ncbi:hypothetical protein CARUB_v10026516mg [Capsella rubella]|uniref:Uncharacterized protein n=1 Tax=Capsella rubella TaxID=81985 RepID=R0EUT7_9BRAS|nr:UPF0496 protein At5g66670 [Capsella rubella]EOA12536.1 hypothetical protein CARUB_v10026516mg [Capsella rubella]
MVFCGLFSELMAGNSSSNSSGTNASPVETVQTKMRSKYSPELSSYTSACKKYSFLKSFDSLLHKRTYNVISSLDTQAKTRSINLESLMGVYGYLLELNQDTVRVIIQNKDAVLKNKDLKSLVDIYFKSTSKTLDFCNTVQKCVKKAEISQLIIRFAVKQFETETDLGVGKKNKYAKTLEELNKFKSMGDPFDGEFVTQYESIYDEQILLLDELRKVKEKLDKKQRNVKTWRIVSNVVFVTAFVAAFVLSVAAAAMVAPPVLSAVASGLTTPIEVVGMWCNNMWKKYEKAVERQRGVVSSLERGAQANNVMMVNIKFEVDNLSIRISSILKTVDFVAERKEDETATRVAMQDIKNQVEEFTEKIKEVGERANNCSKLIALGRLVVMGHILGVSIVEREAVSIISGV